MENVNAVAVVKDELVFFLFINVKCNANAVSFSCMPTKFKSCMKMEFLVKVNLCYCISLCVCMSLNAYLNAMQFFLYNLK